MTGSPFEVRTIASARMRWWRPQSCAEEAGLIALLSSKGVGSAPAEVHA
jgi:hypothetical protein